MSTNFRNFVRFFTNNNPVHLLIGGYCLIGLIGFLILSCPFLQKQATPYIDNFFTAASAVSTTGLTTVSIADSYNFLGQIFIILLIQIGGLGYMSFGSFIILTRRKKLAPIQEELVRSDFGLPDDFVLNDFIRSVILFSFGIELLGAICLYPVFVKHGVAYPLWNALFHSISAFCTAGFSLFNNSFENFTHDSWLNTIIFLLSFLGAIGFIVVVDLWRKISGKKKEITFTSKIILTFTVGVIILGSALLFISEPYLAAHSREWPSLFQSMTALTTVGFNTVPMNQLSHGGLYLITLLMIVGASPAGTGGGIKSTTIVAVFTQMFCTLRGKVNVTFLGYQIPNYRLRQASASFTFYIIILVTGIYLLNLVEHHLIFEVIFEATSALGTVGLSMGITNALTFWGKIIIIALMLLGRIGPLTIGLALFYKKDGIDNIGWQEDVVL